MAEDENFGNDEPLSGESMDVTWISGSAIAVGPRSQPNPYHFENIVLRNDDPTLRIVDEDLAVDITSDSDATEFPVLTESEPEDHFDHPQGTPLGEDVLIIEREAPQPEIVQQPESVAESNLVSVPENPNLGIENPIIRLENPHYEPPVRSPALKRSYGTMMCEDEEGQTCSVCLEVWTLQGEHRLCSLKCGHLFGRSCIMRWIVQEKRKCCPQCNARATKTDVRNLYATKLVVYDTTKRDELQDQVDQAETKCKKLKTDLSKAKLEIDSLQEVISVLNIQIDVLLGRTNKETPGQSAKFMFHQEKTVEVREGCCRVCAFSPQGNMLVVSHQTTNQLFPGFGIKKIKNINGDYASNNFLFLHQKMLRDLCFHPTIPQLLLSVSFDKCAKLSDVGENTMIKTFRTPYPLWSCCWDCDDPNLFYVGSGSGHVMAFDVRSPGEAVAVLPPATDGGAVVSLRAAPGRDGFRGGIVCCRLNSVVLYEKVSPSEHKSRPLLQGGGPFFCMSYDSASCHLVVSCRPSPAHPKVRHLYCRLDETEGGNVRCEEVFTFPGATRQTLLTRSCFLDLGSENVFAAYNENSNTVDVFSTTSGGLVQKIPANDPVLDLAAIATGNKNFLTTLSDKLVRFFEASAIR